MLIEMIIVMLCLCMAAKKKDDGPRWIQATLDGGTTKGPLDWMKEKDVMRPHRVEYGTGNAFEKDGYIMPTDEQFKGGYDMKKTVILIFAKDNPNQKPMLVHQITAMSEVSNWVMGGRLHDVPEGKWSRRDAIDIFTFDVDNNPWVIDFFKKSKDQFAHFGLGIGQDQL